MKKLPLLFLIIFLGILIFSPLISFAQYEGLVPCGCVEYRSDPSARRLICCAKVENGNCIEGRACQLCHFFVLLDNIIHFVFRSIVLPLATLLLVVAGAMFFLYAESPERINQAKSLLLAVIIGLVLIFAAFLIIGTFLNIIGLAHWTENFYRNWWERGFFEIPCP